MLNIMFELCDDLCDECPHSERGLFTSMFWDCAVMEDLWLHVAETVIYFLDKHFPLCPAFWLFGHNPNIISAIAVAATIDWKKTILKIWFEHNIVRNKVWAVLFCDICLWKNKLSLSML